jgi:hypothetical protein
MEDVKRLIEMAYERGFVEGKLAGTLETLKEIRK